MPLDFLFGTVKENARRELESYTPGEGRKKDLGDHIGDFLTGRGAAIDKAVEDAHVEKLTRAYGTSLGELNSQPNVSIGPITKDTDPLVLKQQMDVAAPKAEAYKTMLNQAAAAGITVDTTKLLTPDAGYAYIAEEKRRKEEENRQRLRGEQKSDLEELRAYQEGQTRQQNDRADRLLESQNIREDRKDERARLERLENKRMSAETNKMQMQLEYDRLAQTERLRSQDRKDKAIAMLFQGLGNLGSAFAV